MFLFKIDFNATIEDDKDDMGTMKEFLSGRARCHYKKRPRFHEAFLSTNNVGYYLAATKKQDSPARTRAFVP